MWKIIPSFQRRLFRSALCTPSLTPIHSTRLSRGSRTNTSKAGPRVRRPKNVTYKPRPEIPLLEDDINALEGYRAGFEHLTQGKSTYWGHRELAKRTQLVSTSACNDILQYIGPTLQKHQGCILIDINPGVGLWSRKLHDVLNPRKHILMEPDINVYESFLQPLVDAPQSRYVHVQDDTIMYDTYERLWKDHVLEVPAKGTEGLVNNDILVTGFLGAKKTLGTMSTRGTVAKQMLEHFISSSTEQKLFHRHGVVRMLMWLDDREKTYFLPGMISGVLKNHWPIERAADVHAVADSGEWTFQQKRGGRAPKLDNYNALQVASRMKESGLEVPANRSPIWHQEAMQKLDKGAPASLEVAISDIASIPSRADLLKFVMKEDHDTRSINTITPVTWDLIAKARKQILSGQLVVPERGTLTPEWVEIRAAYYRIIDAVGREDLQYRYLLHLYEVLQLEKKLVHAKDEDQDTLVNKNKHAEMMSQLKKIEKSLDWREREKLETTVDDYLGLTSNPARLMRDRRQYEAMILSPKEFMPNTTLALLDVQPKPDPNMDEYHIRYMRDLLYPLSYRGARSLGAALESCAPGASTLLDDLPELRDIEKGGRLDPKNEIRARALTVTMLDAILKAWRKWPHKPPGADSEHWFEMRMFDGKRSNQRPSN